MTRPQAWLVTLSIFAATAIPSIHAFAGEGEGKNFEERKAHILKELDERAAKLQEHKGCVSAATDPAGLKACREKMKEWRQGEKEERREHRRERLERRMKKLDEKAKAE